MNLQTRKNPTDQAKYVANYMANLALQASNNQKNLNANMIFKQTGISPSAAAPKDLRTTTEKASDRASMIIEVRNFLTSTKIGTISSANGVAQELTNDELIFVIRYKQFIERDFKSRDAPTPVIINYIRKLLAREEFTDGVELGLQQETGNDIVLGLEQIARDMVRPSDLDNLIREVNRAGRMLHGQGERLSHEVSNGLGEMVRLLDSVDMSLQRMQNVAPMDRADLYEMINMAVQNLPTRAELRQEMDALERSIQRQDRDGMVDQLVEINARTKQLPVAEEIADAVRVELDKRLREERSMNRQAMEASPRMFNAPKKAQRLRSEISSSQGPHEGSDNLTSPSMSFSNPERPAGTASIYVPKMSELEPPSSGRTATYSQSSPRANLEEKSPNPRSALRSVSPPRAKQIHVRNYEEFADLPIDEKRAFLRFSHLQYKVQSRNQTNVVTIPLPRILQNVSTTRGFGWNTDTNIPELVQHYFDEGGAHMGGNGFKMKGRGLAARVEGVIEKPKSYVQFGRYLINRHKLADNICMIKQLSGPPAIPSFRISNALKRVLSEMIKGANPSYKSMGDLTDEDKQILHKIVKKSQFDLEVPDISDAECENDRFDILKGELVAGNNSKPLVKEFKSMLLKFMNEGRISKTEGRELLVNLTELGF